MALPLQYLCLTYAWSAVVGFLLSIYNFSLELDMQLHSILYIPNYKTLNSIGCLFTQPISCSLRMETLETCSITNVSS